MRMKYTEPLSVTDPKIASMAYGWDTSKITRGSNAKRDFLCPRCDKIFNARINHTANGKGYCLACTKYLQRSLTKPSLLITHPDIAAEAYGWNPDEVTAGSGKKLEWKCNDCKRVRKAIVADMVRYGKKCVCMSLFGGSLLDTHPDIAAEAYGWNPDEITAGSNYKKEWLCKSCGDKWFCSIKGRTSDNAKCICKKSGYERTGEVLSLDGKKVLCVNEERTLLFRYPELCEQLVNPEIAKYISYGSKVKVEWKCPVCITVWSATIVSRTLHKTGCPACSKNGFDATKPAWLYFTGGNRNKIEMTQYGVTGHIDERLKRHRTNGFTHDVGRSFLYFPVGADALTIETQIGRALRTKGILSIKDDPKIIDKFAGYKETFKTELLSCQSLEELLNQLGIELPEGKYEWVLCKEPRSNSRSLRTPEERKQ